MRFEPNLGQADPRAAFVAHGAGNAALLTPTGLVLRLVPPGQAGRGVQSAIAPAAPAGALLRLRLLGTAPHPRLVGQDRLPGLSNYLTGDDPHRWHTGVPG